MREREVAVWNAGDLSKALEMKRMDSSSGLTLPLYDEDTSILFIPSRGESIIRWIEISESAPHMTEGTAFSAQGPVNGAALVPKQLMNVMQAEVARILTVTPTSLWPVSVNIPRKVGYSFTSHGAIDMISIQEDANGHAMTTIELLGLPCRHFPGHKVDYSRLCSICVARRREWGCSKGVSRSRNGRQASLDAEWNQ